MEYNLEFITLKKNIKIFSFICTFVCVRFFTFSGLIKKEKPTKSKPITEFYSIQKKYSTRESCNTHILYINRTYSTEQLKHTISNQQFRITRRFKLV